MITCEMSIYSMSITNTKEPVVSNLTKIFNNKVRILVCFRWLVRNISCSWFKGIFQDWVLDSAINYILFMRVISFLSSWMMFTFFAWKRIIILLMRTNFYGLYRETSWLLLNNLVARSWRRRHWKILGTLIID